VGVSAGQTGDEDALQTFDLKVKSSFYLFGHGHEGTGVNVQRHLGDVAKA